MSDDVLTVEDMLTAINHMQRKHYRRAVAVEMSSDVLADMKLRYGPLHPAGVAHDAVYGLPVRVVEGRNILRPVYEP